MLSIEHTAKQSPSGLQRLYQGQPWRIAMGLTIFANSLVLGALAQGKPGSRQSMALTWLDSAMIAMLVCDSILCLMVKRRAVLRNKWDLFDLMVTVVSIIPALGLFSALRILRLVRVLRLVSFIPHGRSTIDALFKAMRTMIAAVVVMAVVFYIFSILCTSLFAETDPEHFGSLLRSTASLYELMIFFGADYGVLHRVLAVNPFALLIFIPFVFVASFSLMNLFVGVLAAAVQEELRAPAGGERIATAEHIEAILNRLEQIEEAMRTRSR